LDSLFSDPQSILHVAELGVVMFLFIIGLECGRRGFGTCAARFSVWGSQVGLCIALLICVGLALGYPVAQSFVAGTGFVLTSTAIVMQMLEERRSLQLPKGRRIISILLLEDLAIVPLLALVAFLAPGGAKVGLTDRLVGVAIGLAAIASLIAAGRWLLDPMFRLLGRAKAREVMTAAALLVVLGAALLMQAAGLSMAMGASLPVCCCRNPRFATRSRPISSRSGACCSGFSFSASGWRSILPWWRKTGASSPSPSWPIWCSRRSAFMRSHGCSAPARARRGSARS
jgi:CPA2 family monovalent cation:H+ antiporter-2/glutathione-regulated potassium-efflux system protein KefB